MIDGILEFTYRPVPKKGIANALFFGILALSIIPVVLSVIMLRYKGLISLCAVVLFTVAIVIYARYIAAEYAYVVMYSGNSPMLVATKTIGKRVTTLLSVALSDISLVAEKGTDEANRVEKKGVKKYNFSVSIIPDKTYILVAKTRYENMLITLEGSCDFARRIDEYAVIARAYEQEHADDDY